MKLRRSIGYVMQNGGLLPHRTVLDNISTVPLLDGVSKQQAHARARELMELVGLDTKMAGRYPGQLSGGQQQRVGGGPRAGGDPNILLMDEPFGAVDPLVRADLQDETAPHPAHAGQDHRVRHPRRRRGAAPGRQIILLSEGGHVAQRGTGPELLGQPASLFVADFMGLDRGNRDLYDKDGVLVDSFGRAAGVLAGDAPT